MATEIEASGVGLGVGENGVTSSPWGCCLQPVIAINSAVISQQDFMKPSIFGQILNAAIRTHYEVSRLGVKLDTNNPHKQMALAGVFIEILYILLIYYLRGIRSGKILPFIVS